MRCTDLASLINAIYNGLQNGQPPSDYFLHRMILSARNDDVNDINSIVLAQLPGEERVFTSADSVV
ncbi:hypothetical protein BD410DRAFT_734069, partial [Rickenella mellea]